MNPAISQFASCESDSLPALDKRVKTALAQFNDRASSSPPWTGRKVIIYGAGNFGRDVAALLRKQNVPILGFLDQKGAGQEIAVGLRSYSPASPEARHWLEANPVALIGTHNPAVSVQEIALLLTGVGFVEFVTPMEIYSHLGRGLGWRFWLGTKADYVGAASALDKARGLWADPASERLFLETLLFRLEFDLTALPNPSDVSDQYADPTVPRWREPLRIVDGGAYTGDTLQVMLKHGYRIEAYRGFEPDSGNFRLLRDALPTLLPGGESSLWPCGVWSETTRLRFSEGGGSSSRLSDAGSAQVPVVSLDDVLQGQPVNLIKLDIEGAEPDALQGGRRLIQKYRPGLAICLYHYPHHLWSIPLWVAEMNLGYSFYCRSYAQSTFETVLYALPG
jgi:FkbM family methyltransferase